MISHKRIIIIGLFPDAEHAPVTQASELAKLLRSNGYQVLTVSKHRNKWLRLTDIILTLFTKVSQYDAAIIQFYSGNSFIWQSIAASIVKLLGKKLVFTIHGGGVPDAIARSESKYLAVLRKADAITVPSAFIAAKLNQYNISTTLIENTIALDKYPFYDKAEFDPTLLWMRSFGNIYNPLMAVRVVDLLKQNYPDIKMYMGGIDMGTLEETKQLVAALGLNNNIEIAGFMNFEKKKHYASLCDIYLSTNHIDNAPVTFTEMWAFGLAIVSTNVGGVPYLVQDNIDALLVNDNDHVAMAEKVKLLITDNTLAKKLAAKGRANVVAYNEPIVYHKWDKFLATL